LQNAKKLSKKNIPLIARTPIIPDVNDSYEEICKIAEYISVFPNLLYYELLPYNPFGVQKYESLGIKNNMPSTKAANKKEMKRLAQIAGEYNIKIRSGT
ncbi:glycyl-radical enzyme activating protein, partial [bacterium]|nr:glycyl-radical enzyme activating protein [bacterium]